MPAMVRPLRLLAGSVKILQTLSLASLAGMTRTPTDADIRFRFTSRAPVTLVDNALLQLQLMLLWGLRW